MLLKQAAVTTIAMTCAKGRQNGPKSAGGAAYERLLVIHSHGAVCAAFGAPRVTLQICGVKITAP